VTAPIRYVVDAKASQFFVHVFATGLVAVAAHNPKFAIRDFSAEVQFVPGTVADASVRILIRVPSLEIMDEVSPEDRAAIKKIMFQEVLEAASFPEIVFQSTEIAVSKLSENLFRAKVGGNLTLHGIKRQHNFDSQVVVGEDTLRCSGDFSVKQSEYGLQIASVGGGAIKVKDDVKVSFYLISRK
jgi:polyisoprenoid-binding protein YceI